MMEIAVIQKICLRELSEILHKSPGLKFDILGPLLILSPLSPSSTYAVVRMAQSKDSLRSHLGIQLLLKQEI